MKKSVILLGALLVIAISFSYITFAAGPLQQLDSIITSINPNPDLNSEMISQSPAMWTFATFAIVFSIVFAAAVMLPFLQGNKRIAAVIAAVLAFIAIFAPGAMRLISIVGYWGMIALVISAIILLLIAGLRGMRGPGGLGFGGGGAYPHMQPERYPQNRREPYQYRDYRGHPYAERERMPRYREHFYPGEPHFPPPATHHPGEHPGEGPGTGRGPREEEEEIEEERRHPGRHPELTGPAERRTLALPPPQQIRIINDTDENGRVPPRDERALIEHARGQNFPVPLQRLIQEYVQRKQLTGNQAAALLQDMMHQGLQEQDLRFLMELHQRSVNHDFRDMLKDYCKRRKRILDQIREDVNRVRRSIDYRNVTKTDYSAIQRKHLPALFVRLDQAKQNNERGLNLATLIMERFLPNTRERGIAEEFIRECNKSIGIDNNNKAQIKAEIEKIIKKGYHDSKSQWITYSVQKEEGFIRNFDEMLTYILKFVKEEEDIITRWMKYSKDSVYLK